MKIIIRNFVIATALVLLLWFPISLQTIAGGTRDQSDTELATLATTIVYVFAIILTYYSARIKKK